MKRMTLAAALLLLLLCCFSLAHARLVHQWLFRSASDALRDRVTGALLGKLSGDAALRNGRLQVSERSDPLL